VRSGPIRTLPKGWGGVVPALPMFGTSTYTHMTYSNHVSYGDQSRRMVTFYTAIMLSPILGAQPWELKKLCDPLQMLILFAAANLLAITLFVIRVIFTVLEFHTCPSQFCRCPNFMVTPILSCAPATAQRLTQTNADARCVCSS